MSQRYVVTGGAGFIGSQVVRTLLSQGAGQVIVVDNLQTGREENLEEVRNRIEFRRVDIRDYSALREVFEGCDYVVHLAAIASVPRSIDDPVTSHDVNVNGTFNVLRAAQEARIKRLVFASSSAAYGDTEVLPKSESMLPQPKSPYAAQKVAGELYATAFSDCYGLETVSLRFFNVYGPRQDPSSAYSGVLSILMRCILENTTPTFHGDGEQSRDFTFVEDLAELISKALHTEGISGKVINAGNGNRFTLNEIWWTLRKITGTQLQPKYGPPRIGDVRHSQADTSAVVQYLQYEPKYNLEQGLERTFEWYKKDAAARTLLAR